MSLNLVGHAKGQAQVVLGVGAIIRQAGANEVGLEGSYGEVFRDGDVQPSAHLQGESIGAGFHSGRVREEAVESVYAAKQRFAEQLAFMLRADAEGVAGPPP